MAKDKADATEATPVKLTPEQARQRLKEIADEKAKTNEEAAALRATLDEGKEDRKKQRTAGAMLKKLFKDRRAVILRSLPLAQAAAGANGSAEELAEVMERLETAQDDCIEILGHQKAIMEDENHVPDISNLELPDVPNTARTRAPASTSAPEKKSGKKGKKKPKK